MKNKRNNSLLFIKEGEYKNMSEHFGLPIIEVKGIGILKEVKQVFKLEEDNQLSIQNYK